MIASLLAAALLLPRPSTVTASWYGPGFHGHLTASGQTFDQHAMTCASPSLPFGAVLLLERGQRRVVVTCNDRGPYAVDSVGRALHPLSPHPRRQLDISAGAMKALGGISAGVVELRAWRLL
jgi:rare lipoprotein A